MAAEINIKDLLNHWFNYYGKLPYTFEELTIFRELVETKSDEVLQYAITNYAFNEGSTNLLLKIRNGETDDICAGLLPFAEEDYEKLKDVFISEVTKTYMHPEAPQPFDIATTTKPPIPDLTDDDWQIVLKEINLILQRKER